MSLLFIIISLEAASRNKWCFLISAVNDQHTLSDKS